jgi:hypothetical protein
MLVGAELNAELAKRTKVGAIEQQPEPPVITNSISLREADGTWVSRM